MQFLENVPLRPKTTMRIGGTARYFAELKTKADIEEAVQYSVQKKIPLIPLGSGSNTIFAEGEISALVVQIKHDSVHCEENRITVGAGKNLPMLINELAAKGFDLSPLTGIPGTVGGAIFGNAGQGPKGLWIDSFIESVTAYIDGAWKILKRDECEFSYRESYFKNVSDFSKAILFEATFVVPLGDPTTIKATIESLLQKRIATQPHLKTAGSCFKAAQSVPAWQLIDVAGLRGFRVGDIEISPKHANFLTNVGTASFEDAMTLIETVREKIPQGLEVEMRCFGQDGQLRA